MITAGQYLEKVAFSTTSEGHKLDAKNYQSAADYLDNVSKAEREYRSKAPVRSYLRQGVAGIFTTEALRNKMQYLAAKHKKGENSYNPIKGWTDEEYKKNKGKSKKKSLRK